MGSADVALREVEVRLVRPDEVVRFSTLLRRHHYLGFRKMCGRRLRHVAVHRGRWLALLGWQSAALHCAARERWIGWSSLQRRSRLFLVSNNTRFLILPAGEGVHCLASRVLGLSLRRLASDWLALHGHRLLLTESFVDPARFAGTCYRAANWIEAGSTQGFGRVRGERMYAQHGAPKTVFLYPLRRNAAKLLRQAIPDPAWRPFMPKLQLTGEQFSSLCEALATIPDKRDPRGLRYPLPTVLTMLLGSRLAGGTSITEASDFGRSLSQDILKRIGSHRSPLSGRYTAPGGSTLHYILKGVDIQQAEKVLAHWMKGQLDPRAVAMDGKTLRGSYNRDLDEEGKPRDDPAWQQLSTVDLDSRAVIGQVGYSGEKDAAEGAALRAQLEQLEPGTIVLADALHTSRETAQRIEELGLHYVFQAKGNQPKIFETLSEYGWPNPELRAVDLGHGRIETRWVSCSGEIEQGLAQPWLDFPGVRFAVRVRRRAVFKKDGKKREETAYYITNLPPEHVDRKKMAYLIRRYWGAVENGVHYVRDVALGEDACRVRTGALPRIMAAMANLAISILRLLGVQNIKRTISRLRLKAGASGVMKVLLA